MQTIGIIAAMPEELAVFSSHLECLSKEEIAGKEFSLGMIGNKRIILTLSGIGKVNAAFATAIVLMHYQADLIINTGCAGGLADSISFADVVLAQDLLQHDVDITKFGYHRGQIPNMPTRLVANSELLHLAQEHFAPIAQAENIVVHTGLIVSGDQFIDSVQKRNEILQHFPDALACEMEGAAIAQVCFQAQVKCLVMRSISDKADDDSGVDFPKFVNAAAQRSSQAVMALITAL